MAVEVHESADSRVLNADNKGYHAEWKYFALKTYDEVEVYQAILAASPITWQGLVRRSIKVETPGGKYFNAVVLYETPEGSNLAGQGGPGPQPPPGEQPGPNDSLGPEFNFDTTGGTAKIFLSKETISTTLRGGAVNPGNERVIGFDKDKVEGCDIAAPKLEFSFSWRLPFITRTYIKSLVLCTGKVNDDAYLGFAAGELLFLGASGQFRAQDGWTITYKFAAAPNETDVVVSDEITVSSKDGWDYLWVGFGPAVNNNKQIQRPDFARVERVYERVEFPSLLGW